MIEQVADFAAPAVDPNVLRGGGAALGLLLGVVGVRLADWLPTRYGIRHVTATPKRARRNVALVLLTTLCAFGVGQVLTGVPSDSLAHLSFLLVVNALVSVSVLSAAAIDLEHLILPNELTLGMAAVCILSSPLRSVGIKGSIAGAVLGLVLSYLPFVIIKKLRQNESSMGLGDAKLSIMAGAWHGLEGVVFVLFLAGLQSALVTLVMRLTHLTFEVPESVKAELAELRRRADAGDEEAKRDLADDPMAADRTDMLSMRLPFGPFLALACVEVLFLRRWLIEHVLGWLLS